MIFMDSGRRPGAGALPEPLALLIFIKTNKMHYAQHLSPEDVRSLEPGSQTVCHRCKHSLVSGEQVIFKEDREPSEKISEQPALPSQRRKFMKLPAH